MSCYDTNTCLLCFMSFPFLCFYVLHRHFTFIRVHFLFVQCNVTCFLAELLDMKSLIVQDLFPKHQLSTFKAALYSIPAAWRN